MNWVEIATLITAGILLTIYGSIIVVAAIEHFKGESGQRVKKDHRVTTRSQVRPPFGTRDKLMARILERRLDE